MPNAKVVEKIQYSVLQDQSLQMKAKYRDALNHFSGLMDACCSSPDEFPEGFCDAFCIMVLSEMSVYEELLSKTDF
jgi:hypothetical protein